MLPKPRIQPDAGFFMVTGWPFCLECVAMVPERHVPGTVEIAMALDEIGYSFRVTKIGYSRYLQAQVTNKSPFTLSVEIYFKRSRSNGVITGKYTIRISNIGPGETMEQDHDLYWSLNDWKYAEITGIAISRGAVFRNPSTTIPENYRIDKGLCFVATACLGEGDSSVAVLREWRDNSLRASAAGRAFIYWYEIVGPRLALIISCSPTLKRCSAISIRWFASRITEKRTRA